MHTTRTCPSTGARTSRQQSPRFFERRSGVAVEPAQITITGGDSDGLDDALNAATDVGDEVVVTDPTYAGMINRVRLVGAIPRLVPLHVEDGGWRLDADRLRAAVGPKTPAIFLMNPAFPHGAASTSASRRRSPTSASRTTCG